MAGVPNIALIAMGGTIASKGADRLDLANYNSGDVDGATLLQSIPEHRSFANVTVVDQCNIGSQDITNQEWLDLVANIERLAAQEPALAGVVVTHGTATLEETAYFLHLALNVDIPVVVTGAQRPFTGLAADGPMNLLAALRTAASDAVRGMGVMVVLNEEINSAREVTKSSVFRLNAFQTPELGVLGHVDVDHVAMYRRPTRQHTAETVFEVNQANDLPRVDIVDCYAGGDGFAVDASVAAGAKGIVVAALPPGLIPAPQKRALEQAVAQGVAVAYATRAVGGRVVAMSNYHIDGCITADNLSPQKARILLMLGLTKTDDTGQLQSFFDRY